MIKKAQFADPSACIENISYLPQRNLDKAQIARFAECVYIHEHHNILLMGATGCGKTYLACALGMAAVRKSYQVRYVRLPELLTDLAIARTTGTYSKVIEQYKKPALLILDEWLLYRLEESQARDLLEIAEGRYKKGSIIFCSQFGVKGGVHEKTFRHRQRKLKEPAAHRALPEPEVYRFDFRVMKRRCRQNRHRPSLANLTSARVAPQR